MSDKINRVRLSTVDNPYNPFDNYDDWLMFDLEFQYNTNAYVARLTNLSDDLTDEEEHLENVRVVNDIMKYDFRNIYKKVYEFPELRAKEIADDLNQANI